MNLIQSLNNISGIELLGNNEIALFKQNSILKKINIKKMNLNWEINIPTQNLIFFNDNNIFPYKQYHSFYKLDRKNGEIRDVFLGDIFPISLFKDVLYCELYENNESFFCLLNIINFKIFKKWKFEDIRINKITQNIIICRNTQGLIGLNPSTGNTLWQKDFTHDIAKIEVWNEKVVVIELHDAHTIIALSSDDGQLLWEQSGWLLHVHNNAIYMIYNPDSNILIVKKTDALSGSVINYDLSEILKQNQLLGETMQYTVEDNLIYFSFFYKKIVTIINLETLQLQWLHQIQTDAGWIKEPRVEGNRLYVLDSDQTLHIFEKEE